MNEPRKKVIELVKKLPNNKGRFLTEIRVDLYQSKQWSEKFTPSSPKRKDCAFYSQGMKVSAFHSDQAEAFYRIKVNDTWWSGNGFQYEFFTEDFAYQLLRKL